MLRLPLVALLVALSLPAQAQTDASVVPADAPAWLSVADAVARVQADTSATILVHTYAAWCGGCAKMDQDVYTDDAVQAYLAEHFVPTRVDLEGTEVVPFFQFTVPMSGLGQAFGVSGTPTTVFVAPNGELLTKFPGYADAATFLNVLRYVHEGAYLTTTFRAFVDGTSGTAMPALPQAVPDVVTGG